VSCGTNETFRNCADIQILSTNAELPYLDVNVTFGEAGVTYSPPNGAVYLKNSSMPGGKRRQLVVRWVKFRGGQSLCVIGWSQDKLLLGTSFRRAFRGSYPYSHQ
jgi:hypothetical protein